MEIMHQTKLTKTVLADSERIVQEIKAELRVNTISLSLRLVDLLCDDQAAPRQISLTLNGWTSKTLVAYLAVTAHWINNEWDLHLELLAFVELEGSHSGKNIRQELYSILLQASI
jgi:hypothetical protein